MARRGRRPGARAASAAASRMRARHSRQQTEARLTRLGISAGLGYARRGAMLDFIPEVMGSRLVTVALATGIAGTVMKGKVADRLLDVAEAAAGVALYQLTEGSSQGVMGGQLIRSASRIAGSAPALSAAETESVLDHLEDLGDRVRASAIAGEYIDGDDDIDDDDVDDVDD